MKSQRARISYLVLAVISLSFFSANLSQAVTAAPSNRSQCISQIKLLFAPSMQGEKAAQLKIDLAKIDSGLKNLSYSQCLDYWKRYDLGSLDLSSGSTKNTTESYNPFPTPTLLEIKYPLDRPQCITQMRLTSTPDILKEKTAQAKTDLMLLDTALSITSYKGCLEYLKTIDATRLLVVEADVTAIGQEVTAIVADYTSFGKNPGKIFLNNSNNIVFSGMTSALGNGIANITAGAGLSGPLTTTSKARLSIDSMLVAGNYGSGNGINFCFVVSSINKITGDKYSAKYTNKGTIFGATDQNTTKTVMKLGKSFLSCHDGV